MKKKNLSLRLKYLAAKSTYPSLEEWNESLIKGHESDLEIRKPIISIIYK